jgi:hypothetical protein
MTFIHLYRIPVNYHLDKNFLENITLKDEIPLSAFVVDSFSSLLHFIDICNNVPCLSFVWNGVRPNQIYRLDNNLYFTFTEYNGYLYRAHKYSQKRNHGQFSFKKGNDIFNINIDIPYVLDNTNIEYLKQQLSGISSFDSSLVSLNYIPNKKVEQEKKTYTVPSTFADYFNPKTYILPNVTERNSISYFKYINRHLKKFDNFKGISNLRKQQLKINIEQRIDTFITSYKDKIIETFEKYIIDLSLLQYRSVTGRDSKEENLTSTNFIITNYNSVTQIKVSIPQDFHYAFLNKALPLSQQNSYTIKQNIQILHLYFLLLNHTGKILSELKPFAFDNFDSLEDDKKTSWSKFLLFIYYKAKEIVIPKYLSAYTVFTLREDMDINIINNIEDRYNLCPHKLLIEEDDKE